MGLLVAITAATVAVRGPVTLLGTAAPPPVPREGAEPSRQLDAVAASAPRESAPAIRRAVRSADDPVVLLAAGALLALVAAGRRRARAPHASRRVLRSAFRGRSPPLLLAVH